MLDQQDIYILYNETNPDVLPEHVIQGYRIGAKTNDTLNFIASINGSLENIVLELQCLLLLEQQELPVEKSLKVARTSAGINEIGASSVGNVIMLSL